MPSAPFHAERLLTFELSIGHEKLETLDSNSLATPLILLALLTASAISGCATVKGFGGDVEHLGEEMQEAANE